MSWKYIFNPNLSRYFGRRTEVEKAAKKAGYEFYVWEDNVWIVGVGESKVLIEDCF